VASEDDRLGAIKHIVVLMMENRSFDQMLGYLELEGMAVNGLKQAKANKDAQGNSYEIFEFGPEETAFHRPGEPFDKSLDPCHGPDCVKEQLQEENTGFVKNFIAQKNPPPQWRKLPMGYYTKRHLPVYDFLAHQFCVCDAWHSSIPGDTWPNRMYAMAGRTSESVVHKLSLLEHLPFIGSDIWKQLKSAPIYEVEAFTRQLEDRQWRWYSHDPATLRGADARYRDFTHLNRENFAYFDRKQIALATEAAESLIVGRDSFLDDAAKGQLRDVSWIDPNFIDLHIADPNSNDDHPPSDVLAGQALVLELYDALTKTSDWQDTLLVVVYDEHGGFYDHVAPPAVNDGSGFPTYGVRVPALVVGPRVKKGVCSTLLDHTTLIKTILTRFAENPEQAIERMGSKRIADARHLGVALEDKPRADIPDHGPLHETLAQWRGKARAERAAAGAAKPSHASDGAGQPLVLTEFQEEFAKFALALRHSGLPPGQP
jgi:phospholipase C